MTDIEQIEMIADMLANSYIEKCEDLPFSCMRKFENDICTAKVPNCRYCMTTRVLYANKDKLFGREAKGCWEKAYEQLIREVYAREDYLLDEFVKRLIKRLPVISPAVFINLAKYTKEELRKAEEVSNDGRTDNQDDMC